MRNPLLNYEIIPPLPGLRLMASPGANHNIAPPELKWLNIGYLHTFGPISREAGVAKA